MKDAAMTEPEKFDLRSHDVASDKVQDLLRLFPEIRTEAGKLDFDRLKLALGESVDVGKERYGMNWPGKAECFKTIQAPSLGTLRPFPEESVNFNTTENLIIEGDNLEVLKLLQKSYLGKVKMIYIDPPYNTGNDFIYPDNYSESLQTYLEYTGQIDAEGRRFGTNTEADGRFQTKWINMMYPRLYLARNLLSDDGMIFISIDDGEVKNLRELCDEIFGEENYIECFVWKRSYGGGAREKYAVGQHEYILLYAKHRDQLEDLWLPSNPDVEAKYYKYKDEHFEKRGPYRLQPLEAAKSLTERKNLVFSIPLPDGAGEVKPKYRWLWSRERVERALAANGLAFAKRTDEDGNNEWTVSYKQYLRDENGEKRGAKPQSIIEGIYNQHATQEMSALFNMDSPFSYPKPSKLIRHLLLIASRGDSQCLVLDFFAGSCSTAHATLELNLEDGGNRRFIMVQLPEPTERSDFPTIAEIGKERLRRVIKNLNEVNHGKLSLDDARPQDRGFGVFKLAESNFTTWNADVAHQAETVVKQLELHVDHIRGERSPHDILYELLLKSGFPLTTPVQQQMLAGKTIYNVAAGALVICLERALTLQLIRAIADTKPERVVCLDEGFAGNDQLKANAVQTFKTKGITSFKTV
jgi:adenine-specific DNA-methyltransferase